MLYTSGTTANPKGCVHRHSALVAEGRIAAQRLRLTEIDRFWTPLPFFHCGSIAIFSAGLAAPCVSIQQPFFEPTEALDLLERQMFAAEPFTFPPELLNQLVATKWSHWGSPEVDRED